MKTNSRIETYIVAGSPGPRRAMLLADLLSKIPPDESVSCIIEGAPSDGTAEIGVGPTGYVHVLAPGCPCCNGNLTLRVTLARVLRLEAPRNLIIAIIDERHQESLASTLARHNGVNTCASTCPRLPLGAPRRLDKALEMA